MSDPNLSATRMSRFTSTLSAWLRAPGFLFYLSLLVINGVLALITVVTYDEATKLEVDPVICNSMAGILLLELFFFKAICRTWTFNDHIVDRQPLFGVSLLDLVAVFGWSVRLQRQGKHCGEPSESGSAGPGPCHATLVATGFALSCIAALIAYVGSLFADHGAPKKRRPSLLPISVSREAISSPVIDHGQASESLNDRYERNFISFAEVPLGPDARPSGVRETYA